MKPKLLMPDGTEVEQGGPEDRATWWTCSQCGFTGPHVGFTMDRAGFFLKRCLGSCGGENLNPNVPRASSTDAHDPPLNAVPAVKADPKPFDTMNRYLVTLQGEKVVVMNPPRTPMEREHALGLIAWIAVLANFSEQEIRDARKAVESA